MTKEEILEKHFKVDVDTSKYPKGYPYITEAMSEYAKQECIEFANYCAENLYGYGENLVGLFDKELHRGEWFSRDHGKLTTEQVYELFKKSQSK